MPHHAFKSGLTVPETLLEKQKSMGEFRGLDMLFGLFLFP